MFCYYVDCHGVVVTFHSGGLWFRLGVMMACVCVHTESFIWQKSAGRVLRSDSDDTGSFLKSPDIFN